jgi:hypothetical protein
MAFGMRHPKMGSICSLYTDEKGAFCSESLSLNQLKKSIFFSILLYFRAPVPTGRQTLRRWHEYCGSKATIQRSFLTKTLSIITTNALNRASNGDAHPDSIFSFAPVCFLNPKKGGTQT